MIKKIKFLPGFSCVTHTVVLVSQSQLAIWDATFVGGDSCRSLSTTTRFVARATNGVHSKAKTSCSLPLWPQSLKKPSGIVFLVKVSLACRLARPVFLKYNYPVCYGYFPQPLLIQTNVLPYWFGIKVCTRLNLSQVWRRREQSKTCRAVVLED